MKGSVKITISKDMMSAKAFIDMDGDDEITEEYILELLKEKDIKAGVKRDVIQSIFEENPYGKEYVIAEGQPAKTGDPGYYKFFFDTEKKEYRPRILEDGSVDYSIQRELVKAGDLLAEYQPSKSGIFGYTIFANVVAPIPPKELPPLYLSGVERKDNLYYATTNGEVSYRDDTLAVNDLLTIDGNASNATGTIVFTGDIRIRGDVISGVTIKVEGNVIVDGVVEGATIEAGKDIIVKQGIHGQGKAVIKANGTVCSTFIEETKVEAGKNVTFNNAYHSFLTAQEEIHAEGKFGNILGGVSIAKKGIYTKTAGNSSEINTKLCISEQEDDIDPRSCIVIEKEQFPGTEIQFGEFAFKGLDMSGEYHLVHGVVNRYELGKFVYIPEKNPDVEVKKPTILLVDDEPMILKTFYSYLSKDYKVMAVNSAKDAFVLMEKTLPDLILLDYKMPNMDGGQMLEQMRKMTWKWYNKVPVIFATAVTDKSVVEKCLSLYPQGYLIKPLGQDELLDVVNKFFEENKK